jgi:uncharacterized protein (TIGR03435 family)
MKKFMLWAIAGVLLSSVALQAQDFTGTWQGTLNAGGRDLRIVIKISKADNGDLKAMFFSIDQPGPGIGSGTITAQNSNIKIPVPGIGGTYEGKLTSETGSLTGTWSQGPGTFPLNLTRATATTAWAIPEPPPPPARMAADANPAFEVATIKPARPGIPGKGFTVRGGEVLTINTSLSDLITFAYSLHAKQILNGTDWISSEKYDITGKADVPGLPAIDQFKIMIQKLVADRFQLKFHREMKELSAYVVTVAKTGAKLTPTSADPKSLPGLGFRGPGRLVVRNATLAEFAGVMQGTAMDRPVVDQTGLTARYDFTLNWTPDEFQFADIRGPNGALPPPPPGGDATEYPDLFTAIQQQLGLKIDSGKAPVDVLVIDRVNKPSEN